MSGDKSKELPGRGDAASKVADVLASTEAAVSAAETGSTGVYKVLIDHLLSSDALLSERMVMLGQLTQMEEELGVRLQELPAGVVSMGSVELADVFSPELGSILNAIREEDATSLAEVRDRIIRLKQEARL